uniref:Meiosis-specific nuclear structural protein 1 n=1 Tax=Alexandrium catenella TaxID=2925 RepID=A0A7S1QA76_ALECA|mmetsp:Transcript_24361/g.66441  ORF Transcript_24361/g.66441 Transcript_24361/m.66441 type:complete len:223 (+) Transcript_24361:98-766(+)|eukprot:CAMPEP_0171212992 /NCGR_PEP_ID=MMETSP0790-20130122/30416_1 /TAXON_ID=2925 /ORGANISM="Alexandrium catenella, Strain OF101" /LENGTH=222 /DNA_ID=CAMNT_0011678689 /DNA_START=97 /DNA_END=765 /DNA_ORIENTATION=+
MQRFAVVALCLGFAAEAVLFGNELAAEASSSAGTDESWDPNRRLSKKIKAQAQADALLRVHIQAQRRLEIEQAQANETAAKAEKEQAKSKAEAVLHLQVVQERKAEHDAYLVKKHEQEAANRLIEKEQERKKMGKLEALQRREQHIRDEMARKVHAFAKPTLEDLQARHNIKDKVIRLNHQPAQPERKQTGTKRQELAVQLAATKASVDRAAKLSLDKKKVA